MEDRKEAIILDKNGDIVCLVNNKIVIKPLSEVTLRDFLIIWEKDPRTLELYLYNLKCLGITIEEDLDISSCSFLDLYIDNENDTFSIG